MRLVSTIYDATSTSGGALDSGAAGIDTGRYDLITVIAIAAGAAAPTGWTFAEVDEKGTSITLDAPTAPTAGQTKSVSYGWINNVGVVPRKCRFQITAGAASTVRLRVIGHIISE